MTHFFHWFCNLIMYVFVVATVCCVVSCFCRLCILLFVLLCVVRVQGRTAVADCLEVKFINQIKIKSWYIVVQ